MTPDADDGPRGTETKGDETMMTETNATRTYHAEIDGGQGGETTFEADSIESALSRTIEWAEGGDWPDTGCKVRVRVWSEDEDGDIVEEERDTVEIPSAAERKDADLEEDGEVVAECEGEWSTEQIVLVGDEAYYRHPNGGAKGAYDRQDGDGVWREHPVEPTRRITKSEARALMLDWGYSPTKVAKVTRRID